jgi:hypothetical protein
MYGLASVESMIIGKRLIIVSLRNTPITAIPSNVEAASRVGGFLASPIS